MSREVASAYEALRRAVTEALGAEYDTPEMFGFTSHPTDQQIVSLARTERLRTLRMHNGHHIGIEGFCPGCGVHGSPKPLTETTERPDAAGSEHPRRCGESRHFPRIPGSRAATAWCEHTEGHPGPHEGVVGATAYCWHQSKRQEHELSEGKAAAK